jgi:hypothetical protein
MTETAQFRRFEGSRRMSAFHPLRSFAGGRRVRRKKYGLSQTCVALNRYRDSEPADRGVLGFSIKLRPHSIRSSALARSDGGIAMPNAFAVLRLITSSNFVACSIGRSDGLAPFKILST